MKRIYFFLLLLLFTSWSLLAQKTNVTISGSVNDGATQNPLPYATIILNTLSNGVFIQGVVSDEEGLFTMENVKPGNYQIVYSSIGYNTLSKELYVGALSSFLTLPKISLEVEAQLLDEVNITAQREAVSSKMDKKIFEVSDNIAQSGGSLLQAMQNLPGITVQDGKVALRGSDKVAVLLDGKQSALTGFGNQYGLDNIPASAIERIEIINNPSAKYDANGNAGIINIVYKKYKKEGFTGKISLAMGLGALGIKQENLPSIRPQYQATPKVNPSLALNYRKNKLNFFFNSDYLYTETLNKNEFTTRTYADGTIIEQQLKRNRNTTFTTTKAGLDYEVDAHNSFTISGLFGTEKIIDNGDEPFFNSSLTERLRLWQFVEDELKTTVVATATYQHLYKQAGRKLQAGFNYTFHREDEKYFFDNILPAFTGKDAFKLLSDEKVADFNVDYTHPLKYGSIESGVKYRRRSIPTNMQFFPGLNSPLDVNAGGKATYSEDIPAVYTNYVFENPKYEAEIGLRLEYVGLNYEVDPNHNTYKSDGYNYAQPFPNMRLAYKINDDHKVSIFYNRRVDRPNEVDIRIFPKYDDAEIIKVGNPALKPQFTNSFELGYKTSKNKGYLYAALYHRFTDGTITRIASSVQNNPLIYAIFQNADRSYNTGIEIVINQEVSKTINLSFNLNGYRNQINAFTVNNLYPVANTFLVEKQELYSGTAKMNAAIRLPSKINAQISAIYLAPDLIPQGTIGSRFSLDIGLKKAVNNSKGEVFINATDLLNTMVTNRKIKGVGFDYVSKDYYETQVVRLGYNYKF